MAYTAELNVPLAADEQLPVLLAAPERSPVPGVVILHDASGPVPFYRELTARLATWGYLTVLPDLFFREAPLPDNQPQAQWDRLARLDKPRSIQDAAAVVDWLKASTGVARTRIGLVGFSLGATLALDLAAQRTDLAVASFYPFPEGQLSPDEKAPPAPVDLADRINGPIIAFWGEQDEVVPRAGIDRITTALRDRRVAYSCVMYDGVGHGFIADSKLQPGRATSAAALDAWASTRSFLERHLASSD